MADKTLAVDGPLYELLRKSTDDMRTVRDKLRELEGREPLVEQYSTAILGTAILGAFKIGLSASPAVSPVELDAERYRWLRDTCLTMDAVADPDNLVRVWWGTHPARSASGFNLDAAIDAARAAQHNATLMGPA